MGYNEGKKIHFFRADGHGTYTSDEMMATYEEDSTIPKFRAPHDPNGNALSERGIRTIISMARTLLHSSGLPLNMWEAAVRHAVWIHNRVTTRDEDIKSPHQLFWGTIPDIQHLHPFSCLAYALIQKETNLKPFEPRAKPCIFFGISPKHDAWLLLDLKTRHEFVSRDVSFFDNVYPLRQQQQTLKLNPIPYFLSNQFLTFSFNSIGYF